MQSAKKKWLPKLNWGASKRLRARGVKKTLPIDELITLGRSYETVKRQMRARNYEQQSTRLHPPPIEATRIETVRARRSTTQRLWSSY